MRDNKIKVLLAETTTGTGLRAWPVMNERGVAGVLSLSRLQEVLAAGGGGQTLHELVDEHNFPHLHADHPLYLALERMGAAQTDALPVVSRADMHLLEGILVLQDVLAVYGVGPLGSS